MCLQCGGIRGKRCPLHSCLPYPQPSKCFSQLDSAPLALSSPTPTQVLQPCLLPSPRSCFFQTSSTHAFFHLSVCKCLSLSWKPLPLLSEPWFSRLSPKVASSLIPAFPGLLRTTICRLPCSLTTLVSSCYLLTHQSPLWLRAPGRQGWCSCPCGSPGTWQHFQEGSRWYCLCHAVRTKGRSALHRAWNTRQDSLGLRVLRGAPMWSLEPEFTKVWPGLGIPPCSLPHSHGPSPVSKKKKTYPWSNIAFLQLSNKQLFNHKKTEIGHL